MFVQVIQGHVSDSAQVRAQLDKWVAEVAPAVLVAREGQDGRPGRRLAGVRGRTAPNRSADFAAFIGKHPELVHIRTRRYAPQTNGVIERFNQSLKYEHLYRHEIADGQELTGQVDKYLDVYNTIRHEELDFYTPSDAFHGRFIPDPKVSDSVQDS